ncbi:MAG: DUF4143 domain-containing protein [Oscillospiraceae bacterium]|jgi:predicted AAA+ superfamily ATPase|nr:DUF4143 domain-containing protein [Oscillospiraceae bacterium]
MIKACAYEKLLSYPPFVKWRTEDPAVVRREHEGQYAWDETARTNGPAGNRSLCTQSGHKLPDISNSLADAADISQPTAKAWLQILEGLGVVYLLKPYANNALRRLTKTPKLYFCDTGLAAHLSMWLTRETLMNGAASGHFFENYAVMELVKNYAYAPSKAELTYYRDANAKEIDVFVEENNAVHPLEIKKSANPDRRAVRKFSVLEKTAVQTAAGGVICMCEEPIPIDSFHCFIPCNII